MPCELCDKRRVLFSKTEEDDTPRYCVQCLMKDMLDNSEIFIVSRVGGEEYEDAEHIDWDDVDDELEYDAAERHAELLQFPEGGPTFSMYEAPGGDGCWIDRTGVLKSGGVRI